MKKSIWVLFFMGVGTMLILGLSGMAFLSQAPGVGENIELKDRLVTLYQPREAVVAFDRSHEEGLAILIRLVFDDPSWSDDAGRDRLIEDVGKFAWRNYPSSKSRPLERVTVVLSVVEGFGCDGPTEVARREVPEPPRPGRPARSDAEAR